MVNENKEKERDNKSRTGNKEKKIKKRQSHANREAKLYVLITPRVRIPGRGSQAIEKDKDTCTVKQRMKGTLGRFRTRVAFNEEQDFYSTASLVVDFVGL